MGKSTEKRIVPTSANMERRSGILLHITSLPSAYGIGDLGPGAYAFADFLQRSRQSCWQGLPLNPTDPFYGNSPYSSVSAFAGNTLLISPDRLLEEGLLSREDLEPRQITFRVSESLREITATYGRGCR